MFKNEEFIKLKQSIQVAKKENLSSIDILYNKIHKSNKKQICHCDIITHSADPFRHQISPKNKIYSAKIKMYFSSNDCLKQNLLNSEYLHKNIGIENASNYYFHKSIEQLNEKEKITLLVMFENPALYNPERRAEKVREKVDEYQKILNNQNGR